MTATVGVESSRRARPAGMLFAFPIALLAIADVNIDRLGWSTENLGPTSRSAAIFGIWVGALIVAMFLIRRRPNVPLPLPYKLVCLFLLWSLLSSVLGETPARSTAAWLGFASLALFTLFFVERFGIWPMMGGIFLACTALAAASIAGDMLGQDLLALERLAGYTFEPNLLGQLSGLGLVVGATLARSRSIRPTWILTGAPILAFAAIESGTRTTVPAITVAALLLVPRDRRLQVAVTAAIAAILVVAVVGTATLVDSAQRNETEDLSQLSGRIDVWRWSLDHTKDDPILGRGVASGFIQMEDARSRGELTVISGSSHNLTLELLRETGAIGMSLLILAAAAALPWQDERLFPVLGYLAVSGLTMPTAGLPGLIFIGWTVLLAAGSAGQPTSAP